MTLNRKLARVFLAFVLLALSVGCSGINASHSISPATFLLPGLMQADPLPAELPSRDLPAGEPESELARL